MLIRIVRMVFRPDEVPAFRQVFEDHKAQIRAQPGCQHLQLLQDAQYPNVLTTLSHWRSPADLEAYRQTELFAHVWAATKARFADKPTATSYQLLDTVAPPNR